MFTLEKFMMPPIVTSVPNLFNLNATSFVVAQEFPEGSRVVDLMVAVLPQNQLTRVVTEPWVASLPRLTLRQLFVLATLASHSKFTARRLAKKLWIEPEAVQDECLTPFLRMGLIRAVTRNTFAPTGWLAYCPERVISVEAKLHDWREVLAQAIDNQARSDHSFVAIPSGRVSSELHQSARKAGVGIIEVECDSGLASVKLGARGGRSASRSRNLVGLRMLQEACRGLSRGILESIYPL